MGKPLRKCKMQIGINSADTMLSVIMTELPCRRIAQKYRPETLYKGLDRRRGGEGDQALREEGAYIIYVLKMVASDKGRFYVFGRIFSGIRVSSQKLHLRGSHYKLGPHEDLYAKNLQRAMEGRRAALPSRSQMRLVGTSSRW